MYNDVSLILTNTMAGETIIIVNGIANCKTLDNESKLHVIKKIISYDQKVLVECYNFNG